MEMSVLSDLLKKYEHFEFTLTPSVKKPDLFLQLNDKFGDYQDFCKVC